MTNEELLQAYRNGDKNAREMLIQRNIGIVQKYAGQLAGVFEYDDLVQEGSIGLMKAIDKFDQLLCIRFSTFAGHMAKWAMFRYMQTQTCQAKGISHKDVEKIRKLKKAITDLSIELCKEPSFKEIAEYTGYKKIEVERLITLMPDNRSIDAPIAGEEEDITLVDNLASSDELPDEPLYQYEIKKIIRSEVEHLSDKEKYVIKARYGFWGQVRTYEHMGEFLGITKQGVILKENAILKKLRKSKKIWQLGLEMQMEKITNFHHSIEKILVAKQQYYDMLWKTDVHPFYKWHKGLIYKKMRIKNNNSAGLPFDKEINSIEKTLDVIDRALFNMKDKDGYRIVKYRLNGLSEDQVKAKWPDIVDYLEREEAAIDFIIDKLSDNGICYNLKSSMPAPGNWF